MAKYQQLRYIPALIRSSSQFSGYVMGLIHTVRQLRPRLTGQYEVGRLGAAQARRAVDVVDLDVVPPHRLTWRRQTGEVMCMCVIPTELGHKQGTLRLSARYHRELNWCTVSDGASIQRYDVETLSIAPAIHLLK